MFIRKVPHKNKKNRKQYHTYKLVDSVRTDRGPRQRDILNLGVGFDLPKEQWKDLANCIEEHITGQKSIIDYPREIKALAKKYARKIIRTQAPVDEDKNSSPEYVTVDLNSTENEESRTIGAEYVIHQIIKELEIDRKLKGLGLSKMNIATSLGVIAGRMIVPGSERALYMEKMV